MATCILTGSLLSLAETSRRPRAPGSLVTTTGIRTARATNRRLQSGRDVAETAAAIFSTVEVKARRYPACAETVTGSERARITLQAR
jgi:hypothetical protein